MARGRTSQPRNRPGPAVTARWLTRASDPSIDQTLLPQLGAGPALARHWPGTGTGTGPALARRWPGTGPALARHWPGTGPALARCGDLPPQCGRWAAEESDGLCGASAG